jgi:PleD family two-component response regulator
MTPRLVITVHFGTAGQPAAGTPAAPNAAQAAQKAAQAAPMPSVLIVDDEPNIRRMVGRPAGAEGYEVRDAADGAAASRSRPTPSRTSCCWTS